MSIDLFWDDDEQSVILCEFKGKWTWDELQAALMTIKRISMERQRVFGAIIDVRHGLTIPGGSIFNREALGQFQKMTQMGAGGKGPVVILGVNTLIRTIFDTVRSLDKQAAKDVHFADTEDEARRIIYPLVQRVSEATA